MALKNITQSDMPRTVELAVTLDAQDDENLKQVTRRYGVSDQAKALRLAIKFGLATLGASSESSDLNEQVGQVSINSKFHVSTEFPECPQQSVMLAQQVVDLIYEIVPGVQAQRYKRSIAFFPRGVFIEYLITRRSAPPGCVISLFGEPKQHGETSVKLAPGRSSMSRCRIESDVDLAACRPLIRRAYELRHEKGAAR